MKKYNFLAFDLGATSGRTLLGTLCNGKIETKELTRFPNAIVEVNGKFYTLVNKDILKNIAFFEF